MTTEKTNQNGHKDEPIKAVPLDQRQHWLTPATIFGGLEFCIPVIMVGSMLIGSFDIGSMFSILFVAFILVQWPGNALNGYIGAKTGRPSSVLARSSFGAVQSRYIIALVVMLGCMGWWAVQTAVAGNAICAMFGIDYSTSWSAWAVVTVIVGLLFALPAIIGYSSMKWTDYVAVPAGLLLCIAGIYLSLKNFGFAAMMSYKPQQPSMTFLGAVTLIVSINVSQWVIAADYTRYAKPVIKDNILIPLVGIVAIGMPLIYVGALMAVGRGNADLVAVMSQLGFPAWGFLVLWLSTWTSQIVNNYTFGLSACNILKIESSKGRSIVTLIGSLIGIVIALSGILNHFMDFLYLTALPLAPFAGVIFADYFMRNGEWIDNEGWNWVATIALICGILTNYITIYLKPMGIPAVQSVIITAAVYYSVTKIKAKTAPDMFTPKSFQA